MFLPTAQDVMAAAQQLKGIAKKTPVMQSLYANEITQSEVFFKCENFQHVGAFKFRGAYYALSQLDEAVRKKGVVAYSSGNHAQAVALAAKRLNTTATIVMPHDAPKIKVAATQGYGGQILFYDRFTQDREQIALDFATKHQMTLIAPFDHPHIIAGQGTAAKELFEAVPDLDFLFVCLGGGGLLAGSLLAAQVLAPHCQVIGVEPQLGNDAQRSLAQGQIVTIQAPVTIADGAATTHLGKMNFEVIRKRVAEIVTVSDEALIETLRFFLQSMKIVVEPTGCLAAAAVLNGKVNIKGKRVGVLVSGGNIDLQQLAKYCVD